MPAQPPYALQPPRFPFRAIAALAGRAAQGAEREIALSTLMVARLAEGLVEPFALPEAVRAQRAAGARVWLASLSLQAAYRASLARVIDATAVGDAADVAGALTAAIAAVTPRLDAASLSELAELARRLAETGGAEKE